MLPAIHSLVSGRQMIAAQRTAMFRRMAEREGHRMEIVEPTDDTTANARKHCIPCVNSVGYNNVLKCNYHGCRCRIDAPFIKKCPKGEF